MASNSVRIRYRPVRLGWCVRDGNWDDLRKALRYAHALWGGALGPILTIGDADDAAQLARLYEVDALYPIVQDPQLVAFGGRFPHLRWPDVHESLFIIGSRDRGYANFLDIYHPARRISDEDFDGGGESPVTLYDWASDDPLRDVFLAQFGAYPDPDEIRIDYRNMLDRILKTEKITLSPNAPLAWEPNTRITASGLSRFDLSRDRYPNWDFPGLYVGAANDFTDIVNFWNLRAASISVAFFDPDHDARLGEMARGYLKRLSERPRERPFDSDFGVWSKEGVQVDLKAFKLKDGEPVTRVEIRKGMWNGLNLKPPLMYIDDVRVLGSRSENSEGIPSVTFELREKPFYDEYWLHTQNYVASVDVLAYGEEEQVTFSYPFFPELNDFYRREALAALPVRSGRNGLGVITSVTTDILTIHAMLNRSLVANLLETLGLKGQVSEAGRIASRVVQQMGGGARLSRLQDRGCSRAHRKIQAVPVLHAGRRNDNYRGDRCEHRKAESRS